MAEKVEKILDIRVEYGKTLETIAKYREEVARLNKEIQLNQKAMEMDTKNTEKYQEEISALKIETQEYNDKIRVLNKEIQNEIRQSEQKQGSIKQMRAELSNLNKQYDELSKAERESAEGQELQNHIANLTNEIKASEYATERYFRNVGNYPQAMGAVKESFVQTYKATGSLTAGFKAAAVGVMVLGKQLLSLLKNPIVAALAAIATVIMGIVDAFKRSEDQGERLKQVFAAFTPVVNMIKNLFSQMAEIVLKVAEGMAWLAEKVGLVGEASMETMAIERDKLALEREGRTELIKSAETENKVAKLRDKVAQKDKYTTEERRKMLKEAIRLEEEQSKRRAEIAKKNYEILLRESKLTENDAEMNKKLAEAKAAVIAADTEYYNSTRRMQQQLSSFNEEAEREERERAKRAAEERKRRAEERQRNLKEQKQKEQEAYREAEKAIIDLISDNYEKQRELAQQQTQWEIEDLRNRLKTEKNLTQQARDDINSLILLKQQQLNKTLSDIDEKQREETIRKEADELRHQYDLQNKTLQARLAIIQKGSEEEWELRQEALRLKEEQDILAIENEVATDEWKAQQKLLVEQNYANESLRISQEYDENRKKLDEAASKMQLAKYDKISGAIGGLAEAFDSLGEHNKAFAKMSKVLALGEIAVNTGKALAAGIAQAQSVPFPGNISAIATTVATIIANIASAISTVKSAKFSKGGYVEEEQHYATGGAVKGKGSATSDSITAALSNGESVLNAAATSMFAPLLSSMNQLGGGVPINVQQSGSQAMGEEMLARAVARGVSAMPAPVVSVEEINKVQDRVTYIEAVATI